MKGHDETHMCLSHEIGHKLTFLCFGTFIVHMVLFGEEKRSRRVVLLLGMQTPRCTVAALLRVEVRM